MPLVRDDSRWPVVVDTPSEPLSDDDLRAYNEGRGERLRRAEHHVQVMDGRNRIHMSPRHRRMIATFDLQNRDAQRRYLRGVAVVTTSAPLRILLTALYQLTPSVCPRKACRTLEAASAWARRRLTIPHARR